MKSILPKRRNVEASNIYYGSSGHLSVFKAEFLFHVPF